MRMTHVLPAIAAMLILTVAAQAGPLAIGATAPKTDVSVTPTTGDATTLADVAKENGLLVIFTCNTCPWVIKWQDRYNEVATMAEEKGIGVIYLNSNEAQRKGVDSLEAMKTHATTNGYTFTYAVDANHEIADAFGASKTPDVFLFDKDMKLVYRGAIDDNAKDKDAVKATYLKDAMTSVASGQPVAVSTTKSIGCGIKRSK